MTLVACADLEERTEKCVCKYSSPGFYLMLIDLHRLKGRRIKLSVRRLDPAGADFYYVQDQRSKGCDCDLSLVADRTGIDGSVRG